MDQAEGTPSPGVSVALTLITTFLNTTLDDYYYSQPCLDDACNASAFASTAQPDAYSNASSSSSSNATVSTLNLFCAISSPMKYTCVLNR